MSTLADKLQYLMDTKAKIRKAIIAKDVTVVSSTPFRKYADKISEISGGSTPTPSPTSSDRIVSFVIYPANNNSIIKSDNSIRHLGTAIDISYANKIRIVAKIYSDTYEEV